MIPQIDRKSANQTEVVIGTLKLYFSYDTPVAFAKNGRRYVSENVWSRTTGKYLNILEPDKSNRLEHSVFLKLLGVSCA